MLCVMVEETPAATWQQNQESPGVVLYGLGAQRRLHPQAGLRVHLELAVLFSLPLLREVSRAEVSFLLL